MKLKFKKLHPKAKAPVRQHTQDAGFDLTVTEKIPNGYYNQVEYGFGIAVEIPDNHVGLLFPRSSVYKKDLTLSNCVGVLDACYRGEVRAIFRKTRECDSAYSAKVYEVGERAIQLVIIPLANITETEEVDELTPTDRGEGGFGSTN